MKRCKELPVKDSLAKKHICYVLITCDAPTSNGQMEVKMSYEGDATLASYLLQGAQNFIDEQTFNSDEIELSSCSESYNIK